MDWRTSSVCNGGACVQVAAFRTSSYCRESNCVEVATADDLAVLVRDSEDPGGAVLVLTPDAWRDLTSRLQAADGA